MAMKGCPIRNQSKCWLCPLPFGERINKCNWFRNRREWEIKIRKRKSADKYIPVKPMKNRTKKLFNIP